MNEEEHAAIVAKLKALDTDSTAMLIVHYEEREELAATQKKRDDARIHGLLAVHARQLKNVTKRIPKSVKIHRAGGTPEKN